MQFVTDRTKSDVLLGTEKGRYGPEDLNRVEQAVGQLCVLVKALDVHYAPRVKIDWDIPGVFSADAWPTEGQMYRYLENVRMLCQKVSVAAELPVSMENLDWEGANGIEQALLSVYTKIQSVLQTFQYSGEFFAGEENRV